MPRKTRYFAITSSRSKPKKGDWTPLLYATYSYGREIAMKEGASKLFLELWQGKATSALWNKMENLQVCSRSFAKIYFGIPFEELDKTEEVTRR